MDETFRDWLIIMNLVGFIIGVLFSYGPQLIDTNPLLWVFVPDCPLAALLFAASLIMLSRGQTNNALFTLSIISGFKYSIWTFIATINYWGFYVTSTTGLILNLINLFNHAILFAEQFILIRHVKLDLRSLLPITAFLIIQDLMDYLVGTHPLLPNYSLNTMFSITILLTVLSVLLARALIIKQAPAEN